MGIIRSTFRFSNPVRTDLQPIDVNCLVDTGAVHLCLPEHIAIQLDLKELERREVTVADGRRLSVPYCGPIQIRFRNRNSFTGALVMDNEPLPGAIPMEDMDLVIDPSRQSVDVNPQSP
ncbi:MAG: clan AA aspartic protease, partial [Betaproteobacteria bacterium]|nr:clan AA aspartic protease [Betaproteobacteria bacterium]